MDIQETNIANLENDSDSFLGIFKKALYLVSGIALGLASISIFKKFLPSADKTDLTDKEILLTPEITIDTRE